MQVYSILRVLTARPDDKDLSAAPHALYGYVDPRDDYSTGRWARDVAALTTSGNLGQGPAIFTGGTGLYFRALTQGLSEIPAVPSDIRAYWRRELEQHGSLHLHALLQERDPKAAANIKAADGQRIVRALEVEEASGQPISYWQSKKGRAIVDEASAQKYLVEPERSALVERIDRRFDMMMENGGLDEALSIGALMLDDAMPAMKAIGVRELLAAHRGEISFGQAIEQAKIATRQYSKRQSTWFRHQLGEGWERVSSC